jgi:agmatine deiminase
MRSSLGLLRSLSSSILRSVPKSDGYHMPAEWRRHSEVLMLWPFRTENWKQEAVPVRNAFSNLVKTISGFEHVTVGVCSEGWDSAVQRLGSCPNVTIKGMEYDDIWMRDTGPTFLISGGKKELRAVDWDFNCWGMLGATLFGIRYDIPHEKDKKVGREVLKARESTEYYKTDGFVLEGGSIHVDGEGTVLTTEECLLNKNRNPHLSKEIVEDYLLNYLGAEKVIWLPRGLTGDSDTNGHIDNICCFTGPGSVLLAWCDDPEDEQYDISREALSVLEKTTDARGRKITVHKIPIPPPMFYTIEDCLSLSLIGGVLPPRSPGERLAASYVNFYLPNGKKISSRNCTVKLHFILTLKSIAQSFLSY